MVKSRRFIYLHITFFLLLIYAYQDFKSSANIGLRDADRSMVHLMLFIVIVVLGIYFIYTLFTKGIVLDSIKCSLWLITGWMLFVSIIQGADAWLTTVQLGLSVLWIFIYHFGKNYFVVNQKAWLVIMKWMVVLFLFYVFSSVYAIYNISSTYGKIPVINLSYYVIVFFPWISLMSNKTIKNMFYLFILIIVLVSFKRGAIIVFPLMLITYSLTKAKIEKRKITGIGKTILIVVSFLCGLLIVDSFTGGFLFNRFIPEALSTGSGRSTLYSYALDNIMNRSFIDLMIGYGCGSSVQYLGTSAHNEWLEFTFNFGIIGLILYAVLLFNLLFRGRRLIKERSSYSPAYMAIMTYMFIVGLYGSFYFTHSTLYVMAFFGVVEGLTINEKRVKKEEGVV